MNYALCLQMMQNNLYFPFNRTRKSGKTEFFEVHIKRAVITHLITVLFNTFSVCREIWTGFIHPKWLHKFKVNGRAILKRPFKRADPAFNGINLICRKINTESLEPYRFIKTLKPIMPYRLEYNLTFWWKISWPNIRLNTIFETASRSTKDLFGSGNCRSYLSPLF